MFQYLLALFMWIGIPLVLTILVWKACKSSMKITNTHTDEVNEMPKNQIVDAQFIEILSITPAIIEGFPAFVLTIRPDRTKFKSINLAITKSQGERLISDVSDLLKNSELLKK